MSTRKHDPYYDGTVHGARVITDSHVTSLAGGFYGVLFTVPGLDGHLIAALDQDFPSRGWAVVYETPTDDGQREWIEIGPVRWADLDTAVRDETVVRRAVAEALR